MPKKKMIRANLPLFFANADQFRHWLEAHGGTAEVLIVGFHKVASGQPSMTWPESVDEALCFGWIDGVRKRIDEESYQIRFTPRRAGSIWSSVNIKRTRALIEANKMTAAGLAAFERRTERKSSVYAYEQKAAAELTPAERVAFKKNRAAWRHFEAAAPSYKRTMLYWVVTAKKPETRARRLAKLIEASTAGNRLLP
jgi:uncharacterized protein YdeI (YjbR/CyaY-like superfamily)